jgi:hypothetical protein
MSKKDFVQAFFEEFAHKISRLPELSERSFPDEAFTLCVVYIDRLASGHYGGDPGKNQENFCRALRELSGNPLFAKLHPRELLEGTQRKFPGAVAFVRLVLERKAPGALIDEDEVASVIRKSSLDDSTKRNLTANLWRASMASIFYRRVRGPEIHGPGSGGLDFDETLCNGKKGVKVDFHLVYDALRSIYDRIKAVSVESGSWFGNPNYF